MLNKSKVDQIASKCTMSAFTKMICLDVGIRENQLTTRALYPPQERNFYIFEAKVGLVSLLKFGFAAVG